jgi:hypothetical protein
MVITIIDYEYYDKEYFSDDNLLIIFYEDSDPDIIAGNIQLLFEKLEKELKIKYYGNNSTLLKILVRRFTKAFVYYRKDG